MFSSARYSSVSTDWLRVLTEAESESLTKKQKKMNAIFKNVPRVDGLLHFHAFITEMLVEPCTMSEPTQSDTQQLSTATHLPLHNLHYGCKTKQQKSELAT